MKYFVCSNQIKGSCYHEFYKGKWAGHTFWKEDSISLEDDFFYDGFIDAIKEIVPAYSPFGETEISIKEWTEIGKIILTKDSLSQEVYNEANEWLKGVFTQYECFTILGL